MTTINAGGAFYRVQNSLNANTEKVSQSMQRLSSGMQSIAPGDRTSSQAIGYGMKGELASLKVGVQNANEALQALETLNNDLMLLNDMVVRLEELNALGENAFNSATDKAAILAEGTDLLTEFARVQTSSDWKGTNLFATVAMGVGKNNDVLNFDLDTITHGITVADLDDGGDDTAIEALKVLVDAEIAAAGAAYNEAKNTISHLSSLKAGYSLDVASKLDVDFAGETTELAKGQILAQAGTAMLAQANAQGQGMLALIQS